MNLHSPAATRPPLLRRSTGDASSDPTDPSGSPEASVAAEKVPLDRSLALPRAAEPPKRLGPASSTSSSSTALSAELALVERLKAGDEQAFAELVRQHGPRMLALARRYLPRESDAEDALQDAFISVFRFIDHFESQSRLTTWLHRITVNAALMRIRSQSRRPRVRIEDFPTDVLPAATGGAPGGISAPEAMSREETREVVRKALDGLQQESRIVVRLRDIEGLDLHEISRILGVGVSTVKSRLRRGRLALRAVLEAHLGTSR